MCRTCTQGVHLLAHLRAQNDLRAVQVCEEEDEQGAVVGAVASEPLLEHLAAVVARRHALLRDGLHNGNVALELGGSVDLGEVDVQLAVDLQ